MNISIAEHCGNTGQDKTGQVWDWTSLSSPTEDTLIRLKRCDQIHVADCLPLSKDDG